MFVSKLYIFILMILLKDLLEKDQNMQIIISYEEKIKYNIDRFIT